MVYLLISFLAEILSSGLYSVGHKARFVLFSHIFSAPISKTQMG